MKANILVMHKPIWGMGGGLGGWWEVGRWVGSCVGGDGGKYKPTKFFLWSAGGGGSIGFSGVVVGGQ